MTAIPDDVVRLMKRCQVGVGGRHALDEAHSIMADCYGTLGRLAAENARLHVAVSHVESGLRAAEEDAALWEERARHLGWQDGADR